MAIESITMSSGEGEGEVSTGPMTPDAFRRGVGDFITHLRGQQAGKVTEAGEIGVPDDEDFADLDWYDGGDIAGVATKLIEKHPMIFRAARNSAIDFCWKRKGGAGGGKATYGKCSKATGLLKNYRPELEFVIWLAADNIRDAMLTPYQIEAIIFHELKHVGRTDKNKPCIIPHDATVFVDEVTEYGLWMRDIQVLGGAFRQLTLEEA